jgi:uncharacterized membrane protein YfcA
LTPVEISLLIAVGVVAGVVNTVAGGGSLLSVPVLVMLGLPGTVANGTNRVGILVQCGVSVWRFKAAGISEFRSALPLLIPISIGSWIGASVITQVPDKTFEAAFGLVMLVLLIPMFRPPPAIVAPSLQRWPTWKATLAYFAIGVYGGAFQAGVGIVLLLTLHRSGFDLVRANAIKMIVVAALALVAVPVFIAKGRVDWVPALIIAVGYMMGAAAGTRLAIRGGERAIRPVVVVAVIALSAHMLGVY